MEYIVLDLEWNSAYFKKQGRFINEIIQIGAVKLNRNFEIVDTFEVVVKSSISKKLSNRVINLTGISNEEMSKGISFLDAVKKYNDWASEDIITMTWSTSDLYAIADNKRAFLAENENINISKYLDLQSYIQNELKIKGYDISNQISLANAASLLDISTDGMDLHTALDDSALAALMLKKTFNSARFNQLVKDTSDPEFYKRLFFKPYYISNLKDKRINNNHLVFSCTQCKKLLTRQNKWKYKNNWFRAELLCEKCNTKFRGMISFRQTYDKVITKKRILPLVKHAEETADA